MSILRQWLCGFYSLFVVVSIGCGGLSVRYLFCFTALCVVSIVLQSSRWGRES